MFLVSGSTTVALTVVEPTSIPMARKRLFTADVITSSNSERTHRFPRNEKKRSEPAAGMTLGEQVLD
jgi:hypothetical protein